MTISANYDFNPTCDEIMRMALQLAGLLPLGKTASAPQLQHARFFLDSFFKSQNIMGASLMQMERATLALVAGTDAYSLGADTIEVSFPMMMAVTGETTQTQIAHMTYEMYQEVSDKTQQGTPIRCYSEKLALVTLRFWPVPDRSYTVSYQRQRLVRNAESGATMDLTQRWIRGVAFQMAHDMSLAHSLPLERTKYLQGEADKLLVRTQGRENEGGDLQFYLE